MKTPLHKQIADFLMEKRGQWVRKSDIEHFGHSVGYNAYTAVRRTQEMTQIGHRNYNPAIEKMEKEGFVNYRFIGVTSYRDLKEREADERVRKWAAQFPPVTVKTKISEQLETLF